MAGRYLPPTKWPTVAISWLTLVQRADPDFQKRKHREAEYAPWWSGVGRSFFADPTKRGAYNAPTKLVTKSYSGPLTFAAGDITGVGYDFVTFINESVTPGTLTTRSAAQMFADISGAVANLGYFLRVVNNAVGATDLLLSPGAGVIFKDRPGWQIGAISVRANTYCDIKVQFPDAADAIFAVDAFGAPYSALVG